MTKAEQSEMLKKMLEDIGYTPTAKPKKEEKANFVTIEYHNRFETQKGYY